MSNKVVAIYVHCIFSTKERREIIPPSLHPRLWAFLGGIGRNLGIAVLAAGGTSNHVHLLLSVPSTVTIAEAVQKLKANSSRWLGEQDVRSGWQEGYGAFSVSASQIECVKTYIANQGEHHRRRDFGEEMAAFERNAATEGPARQNR
ncbi:MAG: IS200/IS605 family transposase [Acidobacteriales bacterium]|nr:IS200/IS605 family transposase [Terriglobales bacterium]